jgi:hypothetical protein
MDTTTVEAGRVFIAPDGTAYAIPAPGRTKAECIEQAARVGSIVPQGGHWFGGAWKLDGWVAAGRGFVGALDEELSGEAYARVVTDRSLGRERRVARLRRQAAEAGR